MNEDTKCGLCAIIGAPNAGKSTLLNRLIGSKISIVSRKVQTTRCRINGIWTEGANQIVFVDTPGLFDPKKPLEKAMVDEVWRVLYDVDLVLVLIDAESARTPPDMTMIDRILDRKRDDQPLLLGLNKCDAVHPKEKLLLLAEAYNQHHKFAETLMISGTRGDGIDTLTEAIARHLPSSPFFYPEDQTTDVPLMLMAAEITREEIFDRLHQELPYQIMVDTESMEEDEKGATVINQTIIVSRDGHKGIVIGKGGITLKQIGSAARSQLEKIFDTRVHLFLRVIVDEKWDQKVERLRRGGMLLG
jgi:GTPase